MPNPTGLYSRIKTWADSDILLAADLNAEFDNILNNFNPEMLAGYSQNQAEMQTQTNPGGVGTESLATSLSGELARLRFTLAAITGNTYWYQTPASTIAQLTSALGASALNNKITSGLTTGTTGSVQPIFLLPANTTNTVTLKAGVTPFVYTIAGTTYTISSDVSASSLTLAPSSQNTATVNDLTLPQAGTASTQLLGENGSQITITGAGTSITGQVGNICAFKTSASEYLIGRVQSTTQIRQVYRGYFFNSSNALVSRGTLSNGDTLTLMKLTWIFATTTGTITPVYTNPRVGGVAPSSPATGDYWFDTAANYWKIYNATSWVTSNATLIGICIQDTANTVGARSFDFFSNYSDFNSLELYSDQQNSSTAIRARYTGAQVSIYGGTINFLSDYARWDFSTDMDTGSQAASTLYYFYLDTNGRSWISKVAPLDRRGDLKGYYHPGAPWRCLGYGWSNSATQLENVESFYQADNATPVSNITAASNIILPYNIYQKEQIISLDGSGGAFTQVLPPPSQWKGKYLTYVRTDNTLTNVITLQSWGTAVANPTGTVSVTSNPTVITGVSSTAGLVAGQLLTGLGIAPNSTITALSSSTITMSKSATFAFTNTTVNAANAAGFTGTVGQQTGYSNYGIAGKFTVQLWTQGESFTFYSDGFSVFIRDHRAPSDWQAAGTVSITGVSANPVKGTIVLDRLHWRRLGSSIHMRLEYSQTTTGTAGTGGYLVAVPSGLTINTAVISPSTDVSSTSAAAAIIAWQPTTGWITDTGGTNRGAVIPHVYDTTHLAVFVNSLNVVGYWSSSTSWALNGAMAIAMEAIIPILGWEG